MERSTIDSKSDDSAPSRVAMRQPPPRSNLTGASVALAPSGWCVSMLSTATRKPSSEWNMNPGSPGGSDKRRKGRVGPVGRGGGGGAQPASASSLAPSPASPSPSAGAPTSGPLGSKPPTGNGPLIAARRLCISSPLGRSSGSCAISTTRRPTHVASSALRITDVPAPADAGRAGSPARPFNVAKNESPCESRDLLESTNWAVVVQDSTSESLGSRSAAAARQWNSSGVVAASARTRTVMNANSSMILGPGSVMRRGRGMAPTDTSLTRTSTTSSPRRSRSRSSASLAHEPVFRASKQSMTAWSSRPKLDGVSSASRSRPPGSRNRSPPRAVPLRLA
mmetsp:Transcript_19713/g.60747  ORF Transcript_19713/g.60747 Transcript_19713/m.60747 type:complete len:337 (+) Transcript_19713:397-1407(+)